jgi:hypothetical protein
MVKVTLGEQPAQNEKPFPKLMISKTDESELVVILAVMKRGEDIEGQVLHSTIERHHVGKISSKWNAGKFTDYNEPITIQNA